MQDSLLMRYVYAMLYRKLVDSFRQKKIYGVKFVSFIILCTNVHEWKKNEGTPYSVIDTMSFVGNRVTNRENKKKKLHKKRPNCSNLDLTTSTPIYSICLVCPKMSKNA